MKIVILTVGKQNKLEYANSIKEYTKRLQPYFDISWEILPPCSFDNLRARNLESANIRSKLKPNDIVWLLDETGQQIDSFDLSVKIQTMQNTGIKRLVIIIGGAYGVDQELIKNANWVWSLSKLVFPHQLVRLILIEQLYRAQQIQKNTGYHHA